MASTKIPVGTPIYGTGPDGKPATKYWNGVGWADNAPPVAQPKAVVAADAKQVSDMNSNAGSMDALTQLAHDTVLHNKNTASGGPLYGTPIIGPMAVNIAKWTNPDLAQMDTNNVSSAKSMRSIGQRLTQMEWMKNLGVVPGPSQTPAANAMITAGFDKANAHAHAQAAFYSNWLHSQGSLAGAPAAWDNYYGQHFDTDGNFHAAGLPAGVQGATMAGATPTPAATPAPAANDPNAGWKLMGVTP